MSSSRGQPFEHFELRAEITTDTDRAQYATRSSLPTTAIIAPPPRKISVLTGSRNAVVSAARSKRSSA
jgi:hypothetical protein